MPSDRDAAIAAVEERCPRCSATREPDQEYCLECGFRLPVVGRDSLTSFRRRWLRRFGWYPGDWVWASLVALALAVAGAAAAITLTRDSHASGGATVVLTTSFPVKAPSSARSGSGAPHNAPPEPATTGLTPLTPETPATPVSPPGRQEWPGARNGWTIVLISYPEPTGRDTAAATALRAANAGLPEVGVLESSDFTSLHSGYYVVFSGIYSSRRDAEAALASVHATGFGGAYVREIAR